MMNPQILEGINYAKAVSAGEIRTCRDIQLAAHRFLRMLENRESNYEFVPKYVEHFLRFASTIRHIKGPLAGTPLILQPWQLFLISAIYGFRARKDHYIRWTQDVIIFIPRKAGKSTLSAVIGLYELLFGETGSEVLVLAVDREQARIVFDAARAMVQGVQIDALQSKFRVLTNKITKVGDLTSVFTTLSRDTKKTADGKSPSCVIVDEAAQVTERGNIEVLHSGMGVRKNPLRVYITTASFTKETKFYEDLVYFRQILNGTVPDDGRSFGVLYGIDEGDDWKDESVWSKANPMHGISVLEDNLRKMVEEAGAKPAALNELLTKQFNVFVSANTAWLDRSFWDRAVSEKPQERPQATFIGFDLAATRDLNFVCTLHRYSSGKFFAEFQGFLPEDAMKYLPQHYLPIYEQAIKRGCLVLTPGNVKDDNTIIDYIRRVARDSGNTLKAVCYDPYSATTIVAQLSEEGLPMQKVGQSITAISASCKEAEELILSEQIGHNDDPFISWQLGNCEVFVDVNNNIKVRKNSNDSGAKIDAIMSMIIALNGHLENSITYSGFGIRFIS